MANVKSVKELILDEQKLVTYISVSKELCVHVNESKTLLALAVEEIKKKQPDITLNVNFILSGLLNDQSARTLVCSETDLDTEKAKFRTVFFLHIYSVSQGLTGVDNAAIVSVNRFDDFSLCAGLVKSSSCSKRTLEEIESLKSKSVASVDSQPTTAPKRDKPKDTIPNGSDKTKHVVKAHATKSEPVLKTEVVSPKKDAPTSTSNGKISNNTNGKKPKGIAGFFSKANSAPTIKPRKPVQENGIKKEVIKEEKKTEPVIEEMDVDVEEIPVKKVKEEPKSASKSASKKNSSLSKIKKTAKVDKKRKRVLHVSDSESDEDPFADDKPAHQESDDEIPPTPSVNTVKITSGILNPKKRRKVVDKTYTDEDGYILTRKEEVYESCSDDEVVVKQPKLEKQNAEKENKKIEVSPPKDKKPKNTKKKISPPQKGKQTTMMNFFKKN